jgi:uncharacterized membrane protein YphA (DoxX/SURF4 family)
MAKFDTAGFSVKTGRAFYGIGIIAFGIQQIIIRDFRPEILPPFPAPAHEYIVFPLITGIAMIAAGFLISGFISINENVRKKICIYLAFYFLLLMLFCHIPYNLVFSPNKAIHVGLWAPMLKELAYCGGAFVMAGSFKNSSSSPLNLQQLNTVGRIFFSTTMIIYGYSHFLYTPYISQMVPGWFGIPVFWTYFGGTALIGAGVCVLLNIFIKPVAFLLAVMIFLWFIFLHIPDAVQHPYLQNGNEIVSAFDALLFSGVALIIRFTTKQRAGKIQELSTQ